MGTGQRMNTTELIERLSRDPRPAPRLGVRTGLLYASTGVWLSLGLFVLLIPLQPSWHAAWADAAYLARTLLLLTLCLMALWAWWRSCHAALAWRVRGGWLVIPVLFWAAWALERVWGEGPVQIMSSIWTESWPFCSLAIVLLSLPILVSTLVVCRRYSPTRPVFSGALSGCLAGSVAALIYTLHCNQTHVSFVLVWYGLGLVGPTALGAYAGHRWLRW